LAIADAPKMGRKPVLLPSGGIGPVEADTAGLGPAFVLSLEDEWTACTVQRWRRTLVVNEEDLIVGGMSGSPIVAANGKAIGVVSTGGGPNPVLVDCLPAWFFRK
jgi:hypothetical protein